MHACVAASHLLKLSSVALHGCISQQVIRVAGDTAGQHSITLLMQHGKIVLVAGSEQGHSLVEGDALLEALVNVVYHKIHSLS